ncbi:MAG: hypothetical protein L0Y54_18995 [Sporichthyaceae bacterium]|nr:hypothetical protein [Sporichthyaceae bacterium]
MIPLLIAYTAGVATLALTLGWMLATADNYRGRHRPGLPPSVLSSWQADFETRIAARVAAVHALREPTQDLPIPDFDSDVDDYQHAAGAGRYAHLRLAELDWKAERDQALHDMGLILRSPWSTPEELDIWADEREQVPA